MNIFGRPVSSNVDDRRSDPRGARRFLPADPDNGDVTFAPPVTSDVQVDPRIMEYSAPEWAYTHGQSGITGPDMTYNSQHLIQGDPSAGDFTFQPPGDVMPYTDPEAQFNALSPSDRIRWQMMMERVLKGGGR